MELTASGIKDLVSRPTGEVPVTSVFLNTDGAVFPRSADYEARLEGLLRAAVSSAEAGQDRQSAERDAEAIRRWVSDDFNRDGVKGLALWASDGEIFDSLHTASAFRNVARVGETPYVVPLQAMLGRYMHIGLAVIERDSARLFRYRLGRMVEYHSIDSDVPGQSDGGGWSQARIARNVENAVLHHFKEAAEEFRGVHAEDPFDALVLAGTHVEVENFRKLLHPYLAAVVHGTMSGISASSTKEELLEAFAQVEQERVSARRKELLERLAAGAGQAETVARGIDDVISACNERRVETLFVVEGSGSPGFRSGTGMLTKDRAAAQAFGGPVQPVDDLIDEVIEQCVLSRARIELFRDSFRLDGEPIAALLRF
ncbi:Vms1/Ankzf1 family peptidyl-tRNA hydrolase [Euzebya tangerina]|uniref:baeRF10 domain-containing protein n=1 Tax=Euzebya tangerina TaxID=591198 RepID=UPI000E3229D7|nr:Vms1/Ankzf1 family peptidyl-tRNA hydrolase [Euzebya tangerina]